MQPKKLIDFVEPTMLPRPEKLAQRSNITEPTMNNQPLFKPAVTPKPVISLKRKPAFTHLDTLPLSGGSSNIMVGCGMSAPLLKQFIDYSYLGNTSIAPVGYSIDAPLSDSRVKVYTKNGSNDKDVVVTHRGSVGIDDWLDNASYMFRGKVKGTKTYNLHRDRHKRAIDKYGASNIIAIGHSRAGLYLQELQKEFPIKENITYNKASGFHDIGRQNAANQTDVRVGNDIVSLLAPLQRRPNKIVKIDGTKNPFDFNAAHQTAEINKVGDQFIGKQEGSGRKRGRPKKLVGEGRKNRIARIAPEPLPGTAQPPISLSNPSSAQVYPAPAPLPPVPPPFPRRWPLRINPHIRPRPMPAPVLAPPPPPPLAKGSGRSKGSKNKVKKPKTEEPKAEEQRITLIGYKLHPLGDYYYDADNNMYFPPVGNTGEIRSRPQIVGKVISHGIINEDGTSVEAVEEFFPKRKNVPKNVKFYFKRGPALEFNDYKAFYENYPGKLDSLKKHYNEVGKKYITTARRIWFGARLTHASELDDLMKQKKVGGMYQLGNRLANQLLGIKHPTYYGPHLPSVINVDDVFETDKASPAYQRETLEYQEARRAEAEAVKKAQDKMLLALRSRKIGEGGAVKRKRGRPRKVGEGLCCSRFEALPPSQVMVNRGNVNTVNPDTIRIIQLANRGGVGEQWTIQPVPPTDTPSSNRAPSPKKQGAKYKVDDIEMVGKEGNGTLPVISSVEGIKRLIATEQARLRKIKKGYKYESPTMTKEKIEEKVARLKERLKSAKANKGHADVSYFIPKSIKWLKIMAGETRVGSDAYNKQLLEAIKKLLAELSGKKPTAANKKKTATLEEDRDNLEKLISPKKKGYSKKTPDANKPAPVIIPPSSLTNERASIRAAVQRQKTYNKIIDDKQQEDYKVILKAMMPDQPQTQTKEELRKERAREAARRQRERDKPSGFTQAQEYNKATKQRQTKAKEYGIPTREYTASLKQEAKLKAIEEGLQDEEKKKEIREQRNKLRAKYTYLDEIMNSDNTDANIANAASMGAPPELVEPEVEPPLAGAGMYGGSMCGGGSKYVLTPKTEEYNLLY